MKSVILVVVAISLLAGCATTAYKREYIPVETNDYRFEDSNIKFSYTPASFESNIPITFENKSSKPISIIWDETVFINPMGQSEKIFHDQMKIIDRGLAIPPSLVPPKANFQGALIPVSRVGSPSQYGWSMFPICGTYNGFTKDDVDCVGKVFGLFVTYEIEGKKQSFNVKYKYSQRSKVGTAK
jgi:hypothetical protein